MDNGKNGELIHRLLRKLYPEWEVQTRLPFWGHSRLYFYCTQHGLFWQNV